MHSVLVVDDSIELLEVISFIVQRNAGKCFTAKSKQEALHHLDTNLPHTMFIDVRLGGEDGREFCKEIKLTHKYAGIKIILMSGSPVLLQDHKEFLADDILEKPFDIQSISRQLQLHEIV